MNYKKTISKITIMALIVSLLLLCSVCFAGAHFEDFNSYEYPNGLNGSAGDATTWTATISNDNAVYYSTTITFTGIGNELKHYRVKVTMEYEGKETQPKYELVTTNMGIVPLIAKKDPSSGQYYVEPDVFASTYDNDSREVDIPVFEGEVIEVNLMQESLKKGATIKISLDSFTGETVYASPIASSIITNDLKENADTFTYKMENEDFVVDEEDFEDGYLTKYKKTAMGESYDAEEKGSWIEGILADIILGFGQIIQYIAELAFGLSSSGNNHLTMDNLIFNKMDCMVIDLRAVFTGGIQVGPTEIRGYFAEAGIVDGIQKVYTGLRGIAITIYIIMLLYVGVRILTGVGTPNEAKAKKYVQYWATGVLILFIAPYFFSAIPVINNALVDRLSNGAKIASTYTISEILEELGNEFAGEDAEIPAMKKELGKRIAATKDALDGNTTTLTYAEALEKVHEARDRHYNSESMLKGVDDSAKAAINAKYDEIGAYIYSNSGDWNNNVQNQYLKKLRELRDMIYKNHNIAQTKSLNVFLDCANNRGTWAKLNIKVDPSNQADLDAAVKKLHNYLKNPDSLDDYTGKIKLYGIEGIWTEDYRAALYDIESILKRDPNYTNEQAIAMKNEWKNFLDQGSYYSNWYRNLYNDLKADFDKVKTAVLQEKLETYEGMLDALKGDPMIELERLAKENNRVIYAIAWIILLFQTFAVLFMYAKRIVVTMILICLFPIVMAMYVLDKMGDGKSQSLETWFKEFMANTTVQFFHAIIYIMIINIAIDAVRADPSRNWFILIIATCSLFPVERIMRDILGVKSTTLGQLKLSAGAVIGAGVALAATGKNVARQSVAEGKHLGIQAQNLRTNYKNNLTPLGGGNVSKRSAAWDSIKQTHSQNPHTLASRAAARRAAIDETTEKKRAKKQQYRDSRSANRQSLQARRNAIKENGGVKSVGDAVTVARAKAATVTGKASEITGKVRNSKVAQGALKAGHYAKYAGAELKAAGNLYKKGVGMAVGAVAGADAMANGGIAAGITSGRTTGHNIGGFKNQKKANNKKQVDSSKSPYNPQFGPISNPTGGGSNSNASLGNNNTPIFNDNEPSDGSLGGGNLGERPSLTPEDVLAATATGAVAGAIAEEAINPNSGVQSNNIDSVNNQNTEVVEGSSSQPQVSAPEPTEINADINTNVSENNNGEIEVTQTVDTSGTVNVADSIKEIDLKTDTQVVVEDGGVSEIGTSSTVGTTDALGNQSVELDLNEKKDED